MVIKNTPQNNLEDKPSLILASSSLQRIELLAQIGLAPDHIHAPSIDETPNFFESPRALSLRLACAKAQAAFSALQNMENLQNSVIIGADTVVAVRRKILFKPTTEKEAIRCLQILSGRSHNVYSSVAVISPAGKVFSKIVETKVKFMALSDKLIDSYLETNEWYGRAGGYAIQGKAGAFVSYISGSYSAVVGLPLYETFQLLQKSSYPV